MMTAPSEAVFGRAGVRPGAVRAAVHGLLRLATLILVGATLVTLLARSWWVFDLFTHFRIHYVVFAVLVVAAALVLRRYVAAVTAAICGAVHLVWLLPLFLAPSVALSEVDGGELRLATLNMQDFNPTPERVLEVLDTYRPDVVALQETSSWWPEAPEAVRRAYPHQAPMAWDLGRSVTLISRYPIVGHQMWSGGGMQLQFPVLTVDVEGRLVTVIAVHPPHPLRPSHAPVRLTYLANVAEAARQARAPVIVLGDFNTTPFSPEFRDLLDGTGLRNAADGFGYRATWPAGMGVLGVPIDHVLVSPEVSVEQVEVGPPMGSDHAAVIVDVRLSEAGR